ncbi:MAG: GFA family protein [Armatimonadetes bacterium]|nr:GFA family protein [Armatimonadota bacterium]
MESIPGSCFCGDVRFELEPPTEFCSHCHCESCRKSHGAAFVTWTSVPENRFRVLQGAQGLRRFERTPGIVWEFCGRCGSSMFYRSDEARGRVYITVASLSGPMDRMPDSHASYEEHVDWIEGLEQLPRYRAKTSERLQ